MVQKSQTTTFWMYSSPVVNNGINYQPLCIFIPKFLCCFLIWASFWFRPWVWVTEAENQQTCKRVGSFRGRFLCFRQKPSRNQLYWKKEEMGFTKNFWFPTSPDKRRWVPNISTKELLKPRGHSLSWSDHKRTFKSLRDHADCCPAHP